MRVEQKANEKGDNLFTPPPVCQEGSGCPLALDHHNKGVNAKKEQVCHSTNVK